MPPFERHMRSFFRGVTGGPSSGTRVVATTAEVRARATRALKRILWLQVAWFLCFVAGGVLVLKTAWDNAHLPAACSSAHSALKSTAACAHHSYSWPLLLLLLGIAALLVTGYVATRLAVRYLGEGAAAFLFGGQRFRRPVDFGQGGAASPGPGQLGGPAPGLGPGDSDSR